MVGLLLVALGAAGVLLQQQTPDATVASSSVPENDEAFSVRLFRDPKPVADFSVATLDGRTLTSGDLRGKVVIVNFWATWCAPCRAEMPALVALQDKYRDHLVIVGVSEDEGPIENVKRFLTEYGVNYPIAMTTPELARVFPGVTALPTTFILDRELRVAQKHIGMLDAETTEHETLALAGLATRASIELVEPDQPVGLANAALAKEIPGVDLTALTPERRVAILQRLNSEACSCGCGLTVAKCRIDDPACGVSLPVARRIVAEMSGL
jgi:thiol-disulfide isomerase/thioredoxin